MTQLAPSSQVLLAILLLPLLHLGAMTGLTLARVRTTLPLLHDNVVGGKFMALGAVGSASEAVPSLTGRILRVIFGRTEKEMSRTYARWVIAFVADQDSIRDLALEKFVGHSMGANLFTAHPHLAISPFIDSPDPEPASRCFTDLCQESLLQGVQ